MRLTTFFIRIIFLHIACSYVFAKSEISTLPNSSYVLGLDFGISATINLGNSTSFPLGYSTFMYQVKDTTVTPFRFGVILAKNVSLSSLNAIQVGLSYHYITDMRIRGSLEQGISPPYESFNYSYKLNNSQLLAEVKLMHQWKEVVYPYVMSGIGAGFSRAKDYTTNVPDYLTITPYYQDKSTNSFSYTLSLGVDVLAFQSVSIGLGYRFSDLGKIGLGEGQIRNTSIGSQLNQPHLYLNTLLFELNCFF